MRANSLATVWKGLRDRVAKLVQLYEEAVEKVNASENQDVHDFLARRLYNMTADIIGSLLLIEDASKGTRTLQEVCSCLCSDGRGRSYRSHCLYQSLQPRRP